MNNDIVPVILCGGAGERLWPMSGEGGGKPFMRVFSSQATLLETTIARVSGLGFARPWLVCSSAQEARARTLGLEARAIVEPEGRDTAAAVCAAAMVVARDIGADALVAIVPSDHALADAEAFRASLRGAAAFAREGWLAMFGLVPEGDGSGYGHVRQGAELAQGIYRADRFVEKPPPDRARALAAEGGWLWNAGVFLAPAGLLVSQTERWRPDIAAACGEALAGGRDDGARVRLGAAFLDAPRMAFDVAVMETTDKGVVARARGWGWRDVGSWDAVWETFAKDGAGNAIRGEALLVESQGCLVLGSERRLALLGMRDVVVVEAEGYVLIAPRSRSQDVRVLARAARRRARSSERGGSS